MSHQPLLLHPRLGRHVHERGPGASDARLAAAVRGGDERAFDAIYDRYHAPLLAFCRHMLGSREEAEDALQQVFVAAHRALGAERGPEHLKAWLYAIARNRCLSVLRQRREAVAIEPAHEPSTDGLLVPGEVERREELEELLADLARLADDQRAAVVLAELGDLSHDEIGVALGVRRDKVKALIFQARETLSGWRRARTASCRDIQEDLATLRGSALRRAPLLRHVAVCPRCAAFEREVARQRSAMALLVPVAPGLALKQTVLAAVRADVASGVGAVGAATVTTAGGAGLTAKALTVAALTIGAGGAGTVAMHERQPPRPLAREAATLPERPVAERTLPRAAKPVVAAAALPALARGRSTGAPRHTTGPAAVKHRRAGGNRTQAPPAKGRQHPAPRGRALGLTKRAAPPGATTPHPARSPARTTPARTVPAKPPKPTKPSTPASPAAKAQSRKPSRPGRSRKSG